MEYLKQYEILFKKAKSDITAAKILYKEENEFLEIDTILFHLQQFVEKSLKSLLAYKNVHFPKTHDNEILFTKCSEIGIKFVEKYLELTILDDYAVEGRYEDIGESIDNLDEILKLIELLLEEVEEYIYPK